MNRGWLGVLELALLALVLFGGGLMLVAAGLDARVRGALAGLGPERQVRGLRLWAAAPLGGALLLTALCFLPSLQALLSGGADHCLQHDDAHPHLCLLHRAVPRGGLACGALLGAAASAALYTLLQQGLLLLRARRLRAALAVVSQPDPASGVRWLCSAQPVVFTAGLLRPRVYLSRALWERLSEAQARVVIAHEQEHVRRGDPLWLPGAALLASGHLPPVRRALLADLALATERACDEAAARATGDRLLVAQTLLWVERSARGAPTAGGLAFGGDDVAARVQALLQPPIQAASSPVRAWCCAGLLLALLATSGLHHAMETVLGFLAR